VTEPQRATTAATPLVVGRYALHHVIARGGMATVHLGRLEGAGGFARIVAIKRLHPHLADDDEFVTMFLDEAKLATRIRHPNVCQTLDVVNLEHELLLVLDYIEGESLARLLRAQGEARIPLPIVSAIVVGILEGLHAAHEATDEDGSPLHLVHRDVSPHNILVGVDGVARLIDFGIAKAVGRGRTTKSGEIKGKLAYMAPEQVRGAKLTRRTDLFSATIVLWELLTRRRLFVGNDDGETLFQVLEKSIELPSAVDDAVPPELDVVVARGLARSPDKRFPTARDMAAAVEAAVTPASPRQVGAWVRETARESLEAREKLVNALVRAPAPLDNKATSAQARPVDDEARARRAEEHTQTDLRGRPTAPDPGARPLALSDSGVRGDTPRAPLDSAAVATPAVASGDSARALAVGAERTRAGRGRLVAAGVVFVAAATALAVGLGRGAPSSGAPPPDASAPLATAVAQTTANPASSTPPFVAPAPASADETPSAVPVAVSTAESGGTARGPAREPRPRPAASVRAPARPATKGETLYQRD
jgi:serine/threonine-protein kinase